MTNNQDTERNEVDLKKKILEKSFNANILKRRIFPHCIHSSSQVMFISFKR